MAKKTIITFNGETLSLPEWAARIGIPRETLWYRLSGLGWTLEEAIGGKERPRVGKHWPRKVPLPEPEDRGGRYEKSSLTVQGRPRPTKEYRTWMAIKNRCNNPKCACYSSYGGRGITVSPEWTASFEQFLFDMGTAPAETSIDRIDNQKGYEKGNCRWATRVEQNNNTRRNRKIRYGDKSLTAAEWSRELGLPKATIYQRLAVLGWSPGESLGLEERIKWARKHA
jgi:hypothetical protein